MSFYKDSVKSMSKRRLALPIFAVVVMAAAGCTGKGCACAGCGGKGPFAGRDADTAAGAGAGLVSGDTGSALSGSTAGIATRYSEPGPEPRKRGFRPASVLDSDNARPPDQIELQKIWEKALSEILSGGEGHNPPAPPRNFTAKLTKDSIVALGWEKFGDETGFQVDRTADGGNFEVIRRLSGSEVGLMDGPLSPGVYAYRVRAYGPGGASAMAGPVSVVIDKPAERPLMPENLVARVAQGKIRLDFTERSENVDYFRIERADPEGGFITIATMPGGVFFFVDSTVEYEVRYSYQVVAGNEAGESDPSETAQAMMEKDQTHPSSPLNLTATAVGPNAIKLTWTDGSDDEDYFVVEKKLPAGNQKFWEVARTPENVTRAVITGGAPGEEAVFHVKAVNSAGESDPSNEASAIGGGQAVFTFEISVDVNGQVAVSRPDDPLLPFLTVMNNRVEDGVVKADIGVVNPNPGQALEDVFILVEETGTLAVFLPGCDRGPESCSVDEGLLNNDPVGYQYAEGGFLMEAVYGAPVENYEQLNRKIPVRDIWPACGQVFTEWSFAGVREPSTLYVNLYATRVHADFRDDPRHDPNKSLWLIETFTVGVPDGLHEPGARQTPTAFPINQLEPGEVFAVNVSVEAGDLMEAQQARGRLDLEPRAEYYYWNMLSFALTYDPAVIMPIDSAMVMPNGAVIEPGIRDPLLPPRQEDDGWSITQSASFTSLKPEAGWLHAIFFYPYFEVDETAGVSPECVRCGVEGFANKKGVVEGPDPDPEAVLAVFYFQVIAPAGAGTALRLAPWSETVIEVVSTNGTIMDYRDDQKVTPVYDLNAQLPSTWMMPGDYQVRESYICVVPPR